MLSKSLNPITKNALSPRSRKLNLIIYSSLVQSYHLFNFTNSDLHVWLYLQYYRPRYRRVPKLNLYRVIWCTSTKTPLPTLPLAFESKVSIPAVTLIGYQKGTVHLNKLHIIVSRCNWQARRLIRRQNCLERLICPKKVSCFFMYLQQYYYLFNYIKQQYLGFFTLTNVSLTGKCAQVTGATSTRLSLQMFQLKFI